MPPSNRRRRPVEDEESEEDQRARQRMNRDGPSDEEEEEEEDVEEANVEGESMDVEPTPDEQLAKKLIRYAMACDFSRVSIRRDGIKEKVLGEQGRAFQRVFKIAQEQLRTIWGMELRELPMREKHSLEDKRKANRSQSQHAKTSSGIYVLSTVLPPKYRSATIIGPSRTPNTETEATYAAFYSLVITIIFLNGGELSDPKLRRCLHRLNAEDNLGAEPTEEVLKRMQAQGYVIRQVQRDAATQTQDGTENIMWYIGPRGHEEVGIDGASGLAREVWGPQDNERDAEALEKKIRASFGLKEVVARENANGGLEEEGDSVAGPSGTNGRRTRRQDDEDE